MTLRLVDDLGVEFEPASYSFRARPISDDHLADIEFLNRNILGPGLTACRELAEAMARRDRDGQIAACRRLLAAGLIAGERARQMERET